MNQWLVDSRKRVRRIIEALAKEPEGQLCYLQSLGFKPGREVVDELALELDEVPQRLDSLVAASLLTESQAERIERFCADVGQLRGIWDRDQLNQPAWTEVRTAAAELLRLIDGQSDAST